MALVRLGESGLEVSAIGLGTYRVMNVKGDAAEARCEAVVDAALDGGTNFFDTSPMYGHSEWVLAKSLEGRRDDALVATKVWARDRAIGEGQIAQALDWYEHVDLYQVHNLLNAGEHMPYLRHLQGGGRITAVGATHYLHSAYPQLLALMRNKEIDTVQIPYNPLDREASREVLPEAEHMGVGVIVMMPFASGKLLAHQPNEEELAPLSEFGVTTWSQALLKWVLSDERVHAVIPATSSADHMRSNMLAGEAPFFTGEERDYVRRLAEQYA